MSEQVRGQQRHHLPTPLPHEKQLVIYVLRPPEAEKKKELMLAPCRERLDAGTPTVVQLATMGFQVGVTKGHRLVNSDYI